MVDKPYNGGQWTAARFNSFIKGALRSAGQRWGPKHVVRKEAWRERGKYLCAGYGRRNHIVPCSLGSGSRRTNNVFVDHIEPVIDPAVGFTTWDEVIARMFVEKEGLQVLCKECHDRKTRDERAVRSS
jgi:hypothetical protein